MPQFTQHCVSEVSQMVMQRRTERFLIALSPTERETLAQLQAREGISGADVMRRLLQQEARRVGVAADKAVNALVEPPYHTQEVIHVGT